MRLRDGVGRNSVRSCVCVVIFGFFKEFLSLGVQEFRILWALG